jgi:ElaB/YqjD/DUF883 family membrane-anchored ribosome-binding protein
MGQDPSPGGEAVSAASEASAQSEPERIEHEIEQTREELGETVEALARKTDVKAQATQKVQESKASVSAKTEQLLGKAREASPDGASEAAAQISQSARDNPLPLAAVGAFAAGFLAGRIAKR